MCAADYKGVLERILRSSHNEGQKSRPLRDIAEIDCARALKITTRCMNDIFFVAYYSHKWNTAQED